MVSTPVEQTTGAEQVVWDLSIFYSAPDDPALDADIQAVAADVDAFAARYRERVALLDAASMMAFLREYEDLMDRNGRIQTYIYLLYATDTTNPTYGALVQRITEHDAVIGQKLLFMELEWNAVDDASAALLLGTMPEDRYRHFLESMRRYKPHLLSEAEEKLMIEKGVTGRSAWTRLFTQMMGALRYNYDGQPLTQSQILAKLYDADREVRRKAADAVTATLGASSMELTYIFNVLSADKASDDRLRAYPSWITARNLANKAPDAVVDALVTAVTSRYDLVSRHYRLKRILLGLDTLTDYDRYAPLPIEAAERGYHWDDARAVVQSAYAAFSARLGEIVGRFFDEQWIHAALAPGKRGGAFASNAVPSAHPYVFLNFTGQARDVMTLAHELGHGVHMYLTNEAQGIIGGDTPLTTAEMASVFGEMMVFNDLMSKEPDPAARLAMLANKIEDTIATVFRQVSMNRFEDAYHTARRGEGELTTERLSELWLTTQRAMFGDSVHLRDAYGLWWSYIPHFIHTPGYVYAYAFGELLVLALFNLYRTRGEPFVPQYLDVLAAGDSDYPENILARIGVDLGDPAFWNEGLDTIAALIDQEEALARQVYPEKFAGA